MSSGAGGCWWKGPASRLAGVHRGKEQPTAPAVGHAEDPCQGLLLHPTEGAAGSLGGLETAPSPGGQQALFSWFCPCQWVLFPRTLARLSAALAVILLASVQVGLDPGSCHPAGSEPIDPSCSISASWPVPRPRGNLLLASTLLSVLTSSCEELCHGFLEVQVNSEQETLSGWQGP